MLSNLRELLRILPCRPTEVSNFRGYVIESARAMLGKPAPNKNAELNSEVLFLLRAQQHLHDLNIKYFPQSGMSEREVIEATAKRVGASSRASLLRLSSCFTSRSAILSISLACRHGLARSRCALLAGFNMPKAEALPEPSKPSSSSS